MRPPASLNHLASRLVALFDKPDVYVVFMEFTAEHRASAWDVLTRFVGGLFPGHPVRWIVVDNAYVRSEDVPPQEGADTIAGDRSSREFSGLDAGIAFARRKYRPRPGSVFVLVNDTFHRSYGTDYLRLFQPWAVRSAVHRGEAVGYVDCYPSEIRVLGLPLRCWIRTSVVILAARTLEAVGKLALPVPDDRIFGGIDRFFRDDAPLSENYAAYLRAWLFGEELDDYAERWHSQATLTRENLALFEAKARSILCEHYFSARLGALGIGIFRVNGRTRKAARREAARARADEGT